MGEMMTQTMDSHPLHRYGYFRVAAATVEHRVADVAANLAHIKTLITAAARDNCQCLVLPELALSGYSCADLFMQDALLDAVEEALAELAAHSATVALLIIVGAPLRQGGRLFNCAVALAGGRVLGVVPKTFLPNTREFYEQRWFSSATAAADTIVVAAAEVPFGSDVLFRQRDNHACIIGVEICEDGWVANPPSGMLAVAGATLLVNLSASPEVLSKCAYRRQLVRSQSARCLAAYVYASAGPGESSTDLVFSGHSLIAENGVILSESERFSFATTCISADIDLDYLLAERRGNSGFAASVAPACRLVDFDVAPLAASDLCRSVAPHPFVPAADEERSERCEEIFALQTTALARRLRHIGGKSVVVGISGGLDSTLALLVSVRAFDMLGLERSGIVAVTMPGFGTSARTRSNADELMRLLGVTARVISIDAAVRQHFSDIGHDENQCDITYENSQARERTQILMDIANQCGAIVIGTGDLSELALGWCTYNGDHMSMYAVNCGVPKTLVRYLVQWCAASSSCSATRRVLEDICATPVSPELLPPDAAGEISQVTEDHVGPYELHDFFLYQVVRHQFAPRKVLFLARQAFGERYDSAEICHWLRVFYRRFFSQQFKRSCMPDGPKVGSVALSPRGDWRMPSDAVAALWLSQLDDLDGAHV